jgi:hypothetical protein
VADRRREAHARTRRGRALPGDSLIPARVYRLDPWSGRRDLWKVIPPLSPTTGGGIGAIFFAADGKNLRLQPPPLFVGDLRRAGSPLRCLDRPRPTTNHFSFLSLIEIRLFIAATGGLTGGAPSASEQPNRGCLPLTERRVPSRRSTRTDGLSRTSRSARVRKGASESEGRVSRRIPGRRRSTLHPSRNRRRT